MVEDTDDGNYDIREESSFEDSAAYDLTIGLALVDDALGPLKHALLINPNKFDLVLGANIRVAHIAQREFDEIPYLRVFFRVFEAEKVVTLLMIDHG